MAWPHHGSTGAKTATTHKAPSKPATPKPKAPPKTHIAATHTKTAKPVHKSGTPHGKTAAAASKQPKPAKQHKTIGGVKGMHH